MPGFNTEVPHQLPKQEAVERLKGFSEKIREQFKDQVSDLEQAWDDAGLLNFSFKTFGFKIGGQIEVLDDRVTLDTKLPLAAMAFKGKIKQQFHDQLAKVLT